jgi:hypothetical protein
MRSGLLGRGQDLWSVTKRLFLASAFIISIFPVPHFGIIQVRRYETIRILTNFRVGVLLPLAVQNLISNHMFPARYLLSEFGSGRRTPFLKIYQNSYGLVTPPVESYIYSTTKTANPKGCEVTKDP